jgi:hypothetical protein
MRTCHPQSPAPASRISAESSVQPLQLPAISGKRTTKQNAALLEVKSPHAYCFTLTDLVLKIREADPDAADPYLFRTMQNKICSKNYDLPSFSLEYEEKKQS